MDNNNQQNTAVKKNIPSWLLASIMIVLSFAVYIVFIYQLIPYNLFWSLEKLWVRTIFFFYLMIVILNIWGLFRGVKELKMMDKKIGTIGIALNVLSLILALIFGFLAEGSIFARVT
jgi:uncharacterized membrane protein HdeD (DUF308 family)